MRPVLHTTRRAGARALATMQAAPMVPEQTQLFINGAFVNASDGQTMTTIDPRTEEVITDVARAGSADVDSAVAAARAAFDTGSWPRTSAFQRGLVLNKMADLLERDADIFAALETLDNGKPLKYSRHADVALSINWLRYYAGAADKVVGDTMATGAGFFGYTLREPIGVAAQIIPWNFPLLMAIWKIAPALAVGCTSVLKLSEKTPLTGLALGKIAAEAGLPAGVLNILSGDPQTGASLVSHAGVDKIAFTGSVRTAKEVSRLSLDAGIRPITMELGGKSAAVVMDSADIDLAVEKTHWGLFFNHGQCCCASSRVLVQESVYDEFMEKAVKKAQERPVGDPFTDVEQGPQVDAIQFNNVMGYIQQGKDAGATIATGGNRIGDKGYFIEPTIFRDVKDDLTISREEIFGPVMCVDKFSTPAEAIARANDSSYGLAAGVFTKDLNTANHMSRGLKAGTVWVNCYNEFGPSMPFGGYKNSGNGRENGFDAMKNYQEVKSIHMPLEGDQFWA